MSTDHVELGGVIALRQERPLVAVRSVDNSRKQQPINTGHTEDNTTVSNPRHGQTGSLRASQPHRDPFAVRHHTRIMGQHRLVGSRKPRPAVLKWIIVLALAVSGACSSYREPANGTINGTVVLEPSCPAHSSTVPSASSPPTPSSGTCITVVTATVTAVDANSTKVAATVSTTDTGTFTCILPPGLYTLEATPASESTGHGVPLDVRLEPNSTQKVILRIDTGIR